MRAPFIPGSIVRAPWTWGARSTRIELLYMAIRAGIRHDDRTTLLIAAISIGWWR